MSRLQALKSSQKLMLFLVELILLGGLTWWGVAHYRPAASAPESNPLEEAWSLTQAVGQYKFSAEADQTLLPRPLPLMIGQTDRQVMMTIDGEVVSANETAFTFSVDGEGLDPTPISVVQQGTKSYLLRDGEKIPMQNPAGALAPTGDFISYLAAAENIAPCADTDPARAGTCYSFIINGPKFAKHVQQQLQAQLEANPAAVPPGATMQVNVPPQLSKMNGKGRVWLDEIGLPRQMKINLAMLENTEFFDSQVEMVVDYRFDDAAIAAARQSLAKAEAWSLLAQWQAQLPGVLQRVSFLAFSAGLFGLAVVYRRRRWFYAVLVVLVSGSMVLTPLLQAVAYARFSGNSPQDNIETLAGLISEPAAVESSVAHTPRTVADTPTNPSHAAVERLVQSTVSNTACGQGSNSQDLDGDKIPDAHENCIGTNPRAKDSDKDGLSDYVETQGFEYDGKSWPSDPLKPDSNGDGLTDAVEWKETDDYGLASGWDLDNDGTPNLWDFDDDGDGVPDSRDLSPFSYTSYDTDFDFNIGGEFDGYVYVDIQVQPKNQDHLRYPGVTLDWDIWDTLGQIKDIDHDEENFRFIPMLELYTNETPEPSLARKYGASIFENDTVNSGYWTKMYLPLTVVGDGSKAEAFSARLAYSADTASDLSLAGIDWSSARIIWMMEFENDEENSDGDVITTKMTVHTYAEPSLRVTGWQVTTSKDYRSAILGTPDKADDDRQLFQLLLGLSDTFLTHQEPDLDEIATRFGSANTPVAQKWGVDTRVAIDLKADPEPHADQNTVNLESRIRYFLTNYYHLDQVNTLIIAGEQKSGVYNQDDQGNTQASSNIKVKFGDISQITQRTLNLQLRDGLKLLTNSDAATAAEQRNEAAVDAALDDLQGEYPDLTASELMALTVVMYSTWESGRARTQKIDNQVLAGDQNSDEEVYQRVSQTPKNRYSPSNTGTLPGYLIEVGKFAREGAGLTFLQGMGQVWQYLQANKTEAEMLGFTAATVLFFNRVETDINQVLDGAPRFNIISTTDTEQDIADAFNSDTFNQSKASVVGALTVGDVFLDLAKVGKTIAKTTSLGRTMTTSVKAFGGASALGSVTLVADIALTWSSFALGGDYSAAAIVAAVATTVFSVALFVISLNPVGAVLVAVFGLVDAILNFIPGAPSISGYAIKYIAAAFYGEDRETVTKIKDYRFEPGSSGLVDPDDGFAVGNRYRITDKFVGTITGREESRGTSDFGSNIERSWVSGGYIPEEGTFGTEAPGAQKNIKRQCSRNDILNNCTNQAGIEFSLNKPDFGLKLSYESLVRAETRYVECERWLFVVDCDMGTQKIYVPEELDDEDKDQWKPVSFYLDVLPKKMDDLWNNTGGVSWIINPDRDGDSLNNKAESDLGTDPDKWDSDGDGLSDYFEKSQKTSPTKKDTDSDGIDDLQEHQRGTSATKKDTDGDGLDDGDEIFHKDSQGNWTGGWNVTIGSSSYRVFSDPLMKDHDRDSLSDLAEKDNAGGPYAYNPTPQLSLQAAPSAIDADGRTAVYLKPSDKLEFTAQLSVFPPYVVSQTMSLDLPDALLDNISVETMTGDRTPPNSGKAGEPAWSFAAANNTLQSWESVRVKVSAKAKSGLTDSADGTATLSLPHSTGDNTQSVLVVVDADDPEFSITDPPTGKKIGGGAEALVIGGFASDETSWVTGIELDLAGSSAAITDTTKESGAWAYTWSLPPDGIHTLNGTATDYLGNTGGSNSVEVLVDNTPAEVTLDLQEGAVYGPPGDEDVISIDLNGTAADNLAGLVAVQISTDDGPWREVWTLDSATEGNTTFDNTNSNFPGRAMQASWSTVWELPNVESVQGYHSVKVMAFDQLGNPPTVLERNIIVDVTPPSDELTDQAYLYDFPYVTTGPHTFRGVANDAGNVPQPSRPVELSGSLDSIDNATILLGLSSIDDSADGVHVTWIGDFNGDRRDDMLVGLPAAADGKGRISIVYGRSGDWPAPDQQEMLADSPTSFVGKAGAGLGEIAAPAGDVNGDGRADILIGDPANNRVYLVFGQTYDLGVDLALDGTTNSRWVVFNAFFGQNIGQYLGAAGDVNGDGLDDILIGATGSTELTYLVPGRASTWWSRMWVYWAATAYVYDAGAATLVGLGDLNNDRYDEFAVGVGNKLYVFEGKQSYKSGVSYPMVLSLTDAVATFSSADSRPQVAALGNVNGDDFADFIYSNGGSQQVVYGNSGLSGWATHTFSSYGSGFVAAPGDVNRDGLDDILIGGGGNAYLVHGSSGGLGGAAADISGVSAAGSAPAGQADLNSDGSADLLLLPDTVGDQPIGAVSTSALPELPPAWLPTRLKTTALDVSSTSNFAAVPNADGYVDGSGSSCYGLSPCYSTIQAAVDARSAGDLIIVQPGIYAPFTIDGKDNLTVRGMNADAIFVDGSGGSFAAKVANAKGVRLEQMTLQNAAAGLLLEDAGGYSPASDKVVLESALVRNVTGNAVSMSRTSALSVTNSTLAAANNHINVTGPFDPAFAPSWETLPDTPWPVFDGSSMVAVGNKLYANPGDYSDSFQTFATESDTWQSTITNTAAPMLPESVMAVGSNGRIYALGSPNWAPDTGVVNTPNIGTILLEAAQSPINDNIYVKNNYDWIFEWDGSSWAGPLFGDVPPSSQGYWPPSIAQDLVVHPQTNQVYAAGYDPGAWPNEEVAYWDGTVWVGVGWGRTFELEFHPSPPHDLYARIDGGSVIYRASNGTWYNDFDPDDGYVIDIEFNPKTGVLYYGGNFINQGPYIRSSNGPLGGDALNGEVKAIAVDPVTGDVWACGAFQAPGIARWDGSQWHFPPPIFALDSKSGTENNCYDIAVANGRLYAMGQWENNNGNVINLVRWNGADWDVLAQDTSGRYDDLDVAAGKLLVAGSFWRVGPPDHYFQSEKLAQLLPTHHVYNPATDSWADAAWPPVTPGKGASYAGAANGYMTYIPGGGSKMSYRYNITDDTWAEAGVLTDSVLASAMTQGENGDVYAVVNGGGFYHHTGSAWVPAGDPILTSLAVIDEGVSMTYDADTSAYYVLPGGDSKKLLRNTGAGWETTSLDTAEGIKLGSELAYVSTGAGQGVYAFPGNDAGGTSQAFWRLAYPPQPTKLALDNVAFVSPSAGNWLTLPDPLPGDFGVSGLDSSQWFGGTGWGPTNDETLTETSADPFVDQSAGLYRMGQSGFDVGYHTYRGEVTVAADGSGDYTSIQAAINAGADRVKINPGVYKEQIYLHSDVELLGSNPDWTIIRHPGGNSGPLVRASGVAQSSLSLVTLDGNNAGGDGLRVDGGAQDILFKRSVVFDAATAVTIDDSTTDIEIANTTLAMNSNGVVATNCAPVDLRNTAIAYNSGVGLSYQSCAPTKLHTYNLFWQNSGGHFGGDADAGAGELFIDPNFAKPYGYDFRTLNFSPVIDAGSPTDPAPPGDGSRVDIGYVEQGRANVYVDDNYCELCANDGLTWQVDAFDTIQDALDAVEDTVGRLLVAPEDVPTLLVSVAAGTYNEAVSVPSHVMLRGSGAENSTLDAGSLGSAVTFNGVTAAGVRDFTLTGSGSNGITLKGAANDIYIHHNIIQSAQTAISVKEKATGRAEFNTIVNNSTGVQTDGAGAWLTTQNNVFSGNSTGLSASANSQIYSSYNLLNNSANYNGVLQGSGDVVGQSPQFTNGGTPYRLTTSSPARDAASPAAEVPAGGGAAADMGYNELLAAPISLLLGKEDLSTVMGNSGVKHVEVSLVPVADDTQPVTATLPGSGDWATVAVDSQGSTVSYWDTDLTPSTDGIYRFYSRATDMVDNTETDEADWYAGTIVADNSDPVVTWVSPTAGASVVGPVELRAQVSDFVAGHFNVDEEDVYFEVNGQTYPATWVVEPWDETDGQDRVFRAWVDLSPGSYNGVVAYARDRAGNDNSASRSFSINSTSPADTTDPTLAVLQPTDGGYVTQTVIFAGTVSDSGSGVASVEVSVDGGATWLPAEISGNNWEVSWKGPETLPFVTYPASARAADKAGNQTKTDFTFTIDEVAPNGLQPVTFNIPPESHLDAVTSLTINWNEPFDGSGTAKVLLAVDQITDTTPTGEVAGTSANRSLNANGDWYVHLAAQDEIGNQRVSHYGPWHVGLNEGVAFGSKQQSIVVDGFLDVENGEWQLDEFLDNDERNIGTNVTYSSDEQQGFFTTWSGNQFYVAWQGGWWELDGTLWLYLDAGGGGSSQLVTPAGGAALPFAADYAVEITAPDDGTLWRYSGGWQQVTEDWTFAQGDNGDTEIRLPLLGTTNVETLAYAQGDDGSVWAIFPATNPLIPGPSTQDIAAIEMLGTQSGKLAALVRAHAEAATTWRSYSWPDLTVVEDPAAGQPKAVNAEIELDTLNATEVPLGPDTTVRYVVRIINQEEYTLTNQTVAFVAFPGSAFIHDSIDGASCSATAPSWVCTVPTVPPGTTAITLTTRLISDLSDIAEVAMIAVLQNGSIPPEKAIQGTVVHPVDSSPPEIDVSNKPFVGLGEQLISGTADDGEGIGVDYVEIQPDGGSWQRAAGTEFWSADLTVPPFAQHGDSWRFYVRAVDQYGQESEPQPYVFTVDLEGPEVSMDLPSALAGTFNEILGETNDSPNGSESIVVEAKLDGDVWREATLFDPDAGGEQPFLWTWNLPTEDGVTHTVELRSADIVGNIGTVAAPYTVTVDNVPPVLSVTHALTEVVVQHYRPGRLVKGPPVLSGTITDGGGVQQVAVRVELPDGDFHYQNAAVMTNTWWLTPELTAVGTHTLRVEATDLLSNTARSDKYSLFVKAAPDTGNNPFETNEDIPLTLTPLIDDLDLDGDMLFIQYVGRPLSGTAVLSGTAAVVYTPTLNFNGTDVFTYTASDGALTSTSTISITVLPVNDAPVITPSLLATIPITEDTTLHLPVTAEEVDNDPITWTVTMSPTHGLVTLSAMTGTNITLTYTPTHQYYGLDAAAVQVTDGQLTDTATISISVQPVDDPPLAAADALMVVRNGDDHTFIALGDSGGLNVLANDTEPDNQTLTVVNVGAPSYGGAAGISVGGASIVYTPTAVFTGTETFTYTVSDGGLSSSAAVSAVVVNGNTGGANGHVFSTGNTGISNTVAMTVTIPSNVVTTGHHLALVYTMLTTPTNLPPSHKFAGVMFALDAYVDGVKTSPYTLTTPITLTLTYSDADVADLKIGDKELGLWYWKGNHWSQNGIALVSRDTEQNRLVVSLHHLSNFALIGRNSWDNFFPVIFNNGGGPKQIYLPIIAQDQK